MLHYYKLFGTYNTKKGIRKEKGRLILNVEGMACYSQLHPDPYYSPSQPRAKQTLRGFDPTFWCPGRKHQVLFQHEQTLLRPKTQLHHCLHLSTLRGQVRASLMATGLVHSSSWLPSIFQFEKLPWKNNTNYKTVFLTLIFLPQFIGIFLL